MSQVRALPADLDGHHVLALPGGADVQALAVAWFPEAAWERRPVAAVVAVRPTGARFRGAGMQEATAALAGRVRLADGAALVGPFPVDGADTRTGSGPRDLYGLVPGGEQARPTAWMTAAARRAGGMVVSADRLRSLTPDPAAVVDLTLWSAEPMAAADAVALVRPALSGARVAPLEVPQPGGAPDPQPFALTATFEYDGAVAVRLARATRSPVVLASVSWREHGPWGYRVAWQPLEPAELDVEDPSPLHVIARQRVSPSMARVVAALWRAVGGTVVDAGGFVVEADELRDRASRY